MYLRFATILILVISLFLVFKCATKGRPGGGPVDKTPPEVIFTFPASDSLGVDFLDEIQLVFSERMDENSVIKSLFISPALEYEIDWSGGDELTLQVSPDSLQKNQTYVITIGSEAQDSRRNKMTSSFQFAFSTGAQLDRGSVSGRIYDLKKNAVMYIYAYELSDQAKVDPRYQYAKFLTQSGEKGKYRLNYLPLKNYRIFVIEDQNKNLLLDASYERIGIPTRDVKLDSTNTEDSDLNFKLTQIDTTAPFISSARSISNNTVLVRASEELLSFVKENIIITDTLQRDSLKVLAITGSTQSKSQYLLYTDQQDSNAYYEMKVVDIADTSLNKMIDPSIVYFSGSSSIDTTSFVVTTILPPDSTKNFSIFTNISLGFSLPVDTKSLNKGFIFLKDPKDTLSGVWDLQELKAGNYIANNVLDPGKDYRFILNTKLVKSVWGDTLQDTIFNHIFSTISEEEFGSLTGAIKIDSVFYNNLYLYAQNIKNKKQLFQVKNYQIINLE